MNNYQEYLPSKHNLFSRDRIDRELILDFFLVISRMEYALKAAGYVKKGRNGEPVIKWKNFTQELQGKLIFDDDNTLSQAYQFLISEPPDSQKYNGSLHWKKRTQRDDQTEEDFVIESVRTVRNNLFHGGKEPTAPLTERNKKLIKSALLIAAFAVSAHPSVGSAFDQIGPEKTVA
jgi:hypothetical protein